MNFRIRSTSICYRRYEDLKKIWIFSFFKEFCSIVDYHFSRYWESVVKYTVPLKITSLVPYNGPCCTSIEKTGNRQKNQNSSNKKIFNFFFNLDSVDNISMFMVSENSYRGKSTIRLENINFIFS